MKAWPAVQVPGKVFLAGEYGVLVGGPSLVMAVNRYARLRGALGPDHTPTDFERAGLAHLAREGFELPQALPAVEARALRDARGQKLGLGSSAAWSVAVTASALHATGRLASDPAKHWSLAHAVHSRAAEHEGSGADVACCLRGGVVRFRRADPATEAGRLPEISSVELSPSLVPLVISGGCPVKTSRAVRGLPASSPRILEARRLGTELVESLLSGDSAALPALIRESAACIVAIGAEAGLGEAVGEALLETAERALAPFAGAAKPSGASGAELVLAYTPAVEPRDKERVGAALASAGLTVLDLAPSPCGASILEDKSAVSA